MLEAGYRPDDFGGSAVTAGPVHLHGHLFGVITHGDDDSLDELAQLGIKLAKVQPRAQPIAQSIIVVRDPQQSVVARLKDLQAQFPGSELKITACERTS